MKWWRIGLFMVLLFPVLLLAQNCKSKDNGCFVRVLCEKDKLVIGDSCLLTYVVYAPQPFLIKENPSKIKVKNGRLRPLPIGPQRLQRVAEGQYLYYALVLEQYVLRTKKTGEVVIPERVFDIEMRVQEEPTDPFDAFWGRGGNVRKIPAEAVSEEFVLKVVEKPRRTMMEMKRSGVQVL